MLLVRKGFNNYWTPYRDSDIPLFKHCCEGQSEIKDIYDYLHIFHAHDIYPDYIPSRIIEKIDNQ